MSSTPPVDVIERALVRIRREQQANRLHRSAGDGAAAPSPTAARYRYLDALDEQTHGLAISQISEAIGVDRPRASRLTSELLRDGLITCRPSPDDSRYVIATLTEQGRALVKHMHTTRRTAVAQALVGFTPDEMRTFADLLDRFVTAWPRPD